MIQGVPVIEAHLGWIFMNGRENGLNAHSEE